MKCFRHVHLIYAAFFTLCALTILRLGTGAGFYIAFGILLAAWLVSAVGLMFRKQWAWIGSLICVSVVWLFLVVNLTASIMTRPGHADYFKDILLLTVFNILTVILGLWGLFRMRNDCCLRKEKSTGMPTTA